MDLSESSSSGLYTSGTLSPDPQTIEYPSRIILHPSSTISSLPTHSLIPPCLSNDCSNCTSNVDDSGESACFVRYNLSIRSFTLGIHSFCATMTFVLAVVIFRLRRSKVIIFSFFFLKTFNSKFQFLVQTKMNAHYSSFHHNLEKFCLHLIHFDQFHFSLIC